MTPIPSELRRAVDVAHRVAGQCGHKSYIQAHVIYEIEFPDNDIQRFDNESDAIRAIETFVADIAAKEAQRRFGFTSQDVEDFYEDRQRVEAEMELIIERAQ